MAGYVGAARRVRRVRQTGRPRCGGEVRGTRRRGAGRLARQAVRAARLLSGRGTSAAGCRGPGHVRSARCARCGRAASPWQARLPTASLRARHLDGAACGLQQLDRGKPYRRPKKIHQTGYEQPYTHRHSAGNRTSVPEVWKIRGDRARKSTRGGSERETPHYSRIVRNRLATPRGNSR